jgi:N-acetylglutamate synthase-like GNAT family acetyltransferase
MRDYSDKRDFILHPDYCKPVMPRMSVCEFDPRASRGVDEMVDIHYLRYLRPGDLQIDIPLIARSVWDEPMATTLIHQSQAMFRNGAPESATFVIEAGREVLGFSSIRKSWAMPNMAEFTGVTVHPKHQDKGFGTLLTRARLELAKALKVEYVMVSTIHPGFFENFGFETIDIHYGDQTWSVMRKEI